MPSFYDVDQSELIEKVAEDLKKIETIKPPVWSVLVKTGMSRERPPLRDDWWYVRVASVLRYVAVRGPVGVQKLRTKYGGKKNRGVKKEHFYKGSGNIIRKALQQLQLSGLVKQETKSIHKGRIITPKGKSMLDKAATALALLSHSSKVSPKVEKAEAPKESHSKKQKAEAKGEKTGAQE